jgi:hypothetical protein
MLFIEAVIINLRRVQKFTLSEQSAKLFNFYQGKHLFTTGNDTDKLRIQNAILDELLDIGEASVNLSLSLSTLLLLRVSKY